jgi:hypothetical protein
MSCVMLSQDASLRIQPRATIAIPHPFYGHTDTPTLHFTVSISALANTVTESDALRYSTADYGLHRVHCFFESHDSTHHQKLANNQSLPVSTPNTPSKNRTRHLPRPQTNFCTSCASVASWLAPLPAFKTDHIARIRSRRVQDVGLERFAVISTFLEKL